MLRSLNKSDNRSTIPLPTLAKAVRVRSSDVIAEYSGKDILRSLHYHGIVELAYKQFETKPKLHYALETMAKASAAVEMLRAVEIEQFLQQLNKAHLDFIVFKGTALAYFLYQNTWQRPRSDTDILVRHKDLPEIYQSLAELGYTKSSSISGQYVSYQSTVFKKVNQNFTHRIDIHWKINNRQIFADCYNLDELLENSLSCNVLSQDMFIPNNVDSILLACIHRIGHHSKQERLIWLYDLHLLCQSLNNSQWAMLVAKARRKNITEIVYDGLANCNSLFNTKIAPSIYHAIKKKPEQAEASAIFLDREKSEMSLFWQDLMFLPRWSQRLVLIKEHLIPDRQYLAQQNQSNSFVLALCKRFFSGIRKKISGS